MVDEFIEILEQEMEAQGMSIRELARLAKVGRPYLHRVLAGQQVPSVGWALRVADVLGVEIIFSKTPA